MMDQPPLEGPLSVVLVAVFPVPESWSGKRQREALAGIIRPTIAPDEIDLGAVVKTSRADQHPVVDLFSGARA